MGLKIRQSAPEARIERHLGNFSVTTITLKSSGCEKGRTIHTQFRFAKDRPDHFPYTVLIRHPTGTLGEGVGKRMNNGETELRRQGSAPAAFILPGVCQLYSKRSASMGSRLAAL